MVVFLPIASPQPPPISSARKIVRQARPDPTSSPPLHLIERRPALLSKPLPADRTQTVAHENQPRSSGQLHVPSWRYALKASAAYRKASFNVRSHICLTVPAPASHLTNLQGNTKAIHGWLVSSLPLFSPHEVEHQTNEMNDLRSRVDYILSRMDSTQQALAGRQSVHFLAS